MENTDSVPTHPKYKRIIPKLSGEVLRNTQDGEPIDAAIVLALCEEIKRIHEIGVEVGLVIGGWQYFSGFEWLSKALTAPQAIIWACSLPSSMDWP